jgi:hypothetical protein
LKKRNKNNEGRSTSSEETPEYFGAKRRLSIKNENIMCDSTKWGGSAPSSQKVRSLLISPPPAREAGRENDLSIAPMDSTNSKIQPTQTLTYILGGGQCGVRVGVGGHI